MGARILVVEDEENLRVGLSDVLEEEGYEVEAADRGEGARRSFSERPPELVVLDVMLPDIDGYTLCREMRATDRTVRILMLTARTLEDDIVRGFEAGADDYLEKPYRLRELLARIRALLRRATTRTDSLELPGFTLDLEGRTVRGPRGRIELTRTEFDILRFFAERPGRALTRDAVIDEVWGQGVVVDVRTVDNFVSSLKKKLGLNERSGLRFRSVRGVGYCLEVDGGPD
ncbi:MAG: response regulator transcription factor [Deltaproteobacteria bacterium]|nr:response regulator transcription factor [Deltaproteobacteria bacterium]